MQIYAEFMNLHTAEHYGTCTIKLIFKTKTTCNSYLLQEIWVKANLSSGVIAWCILVSLLVINSATIVSRRSKVEESLCRKLQ